MQGPDMRRLRLTKLLVLLLLSLALADESQSPHAKRIQRDVDGVTTVLLVPARPGKSIPPVGVLSKTARTFVQDGASTEYATQVLGTTLDDGRFYAKILSTSSRVFYNKDSASPYLVYPSAITEDQYNSKYPELPKKQEEPASLKSDLRAKEDKENDVFHKNDSEESRFKPAKVQSDNLPTYTVKQDYYDKGSEVSVDEKSLKSREPKVYRSPPKISSKKNEKPLATVTYHGFADFTTTVGDTVIVFSPSTAPAPIGRQPTTIKGEPTLRPDDGIAVSKIKPTSVVPTERKTETIPIRGHNSVHHLLKKNKKIGKSSNSPIELQPSTTDLAESSSSAEMTNPLLFTPEEKTGLIKVIDSTTVSKGTTTHYMSSIFGTYLGTNYAQIIHTASNVYFHPEETLRYSVDGDNEGTTIGDILFEQDTTVSSEVTDNDDDVTTIRDIPTTEPTTESDLGNDVIPRNQGRSIKGSIPKNQISAPKGSKNQNQDSKVSLATRLLPSTIYKTFTYFTTFFIPNESTTSTSVKSREVVSSEVTFLKELILPSSTQSESIKPTSLPKLNKIKASTSSVAPIETAPTVEKQEVEEIQLIFKTIFTTFTYLTTFYDDSTTSVSSRKVTATNVITQTVDPITGSVDANQVSEKDKADFIVPTKVADLGLIDSKTKTFDPPNTTDESSTENVITTLSDEITTTEEQPTTELVPESETHDVEDSHINIEPSPSLFFESSTEVPIEQHKTYFTTYTYFTTIIVDDETEIETRTEVFSNVITETLNPSSVLIPLEKTNTLTTEKPSVPAEIQAYLEAIKKQKTHEEARLLARKVQQKVKTTTEESTDTPTEDYFSATDETTIADDLTTTENISRNGNVVGSMKTDVVFTSSSGGSRVLDVADRRIGLPDDQELSETNHHDVEPAPTLLLQTSYTTYTYFTTMYNGDATDVLSRLKTVTNVVTETIKPTAVVHPETKTAQPLTYFTTFTYWTTFIKGDETATTSREETVSNVVTPGVSESSSVQLDVIKTYRPFVVATPVHTLNAERESKATSDNEITSPNVILKEIPTIKVNELSSTISPEPVTLYTTYTYFTTSYIGNSTVLNSRLETITSVSYPEDQLVRATPRAIGGAAPSVQILNTDKKQIDPTKSSESPVTGLLSTKRSSQVNDGTTTHFTTDVYGTYIDGLYAQIVETSTKVELPGPVYSSSVNPLEPSGVISLNKGSVVDADEITTVFYTTKQIGTTLDGIYAKVIESTSSTKIDKEKLATQKPSQGHRTGLVRLIKGQIEANNTTTYYQSKVIGTSIEGRYAQIIESTSSYALPKPTAVYGISATNTLPPNHASGIPDISPSPAVIQSSEDHTEDISSNDPEHEGDEEEDSDDPKSSKKSRLTFSSRKRTSSSFPFRPFASKSRPTFNPKRKPQGATTITRSDITPTITATLAGKGSRFSGSSRSRATPPLGSSTVSPSSSRRFSGRRSSLPSSSVSSTNYPVGSSRTRGSTRASSSSSFSQARRGSSSIRGSSIRPTSRSSLPASSVQNTRHRPGGRPFSTGLKSTTTRHDDQEDNANEFSTLVTEETPAQENSEDETLKPQTTTETPRRANNPLLRFRRPDLGSATVRTTHRSTTTTTTTTPAPKKNNNLNRQNANNRAANNRVRSTVSPATTRARSQSNLFPTRKPLLKKLETTEAPVEIKNENSEEESFEDEAVEEIVDNDYEGSEQKEAPQNHKATTQKPTPKPFTRIGRGRRVRRQISQTRSARLRRPSQASIFEDRIDSDFYGSQEDFSKIPPNNSRFTSGRGRALSNTPRSYYNEKIEDRSYEDYSDITPAPVPVPRARSKSPAPVARSTPVRVKPSTPTNSNRQFTLREKDNAPSVKTNFKRPASTTRTTNIRARNNSNRLRTGTNRYTDSTSNRRTTSRTNSRTGSRTSSRRIIPSRGRQNSYEDYRDINDFDGTITVTHYVPTEVTIPVVNNGITEKRNIITAHPSTEIIGPDRYKTVTNSDGRDQVVLASELTRTNFQGQVEVTKFVIHETPTTRVSHVLTSSGGRKFSQPVVVPSTVYSIENIVSTKVPSLADNSPLANILLSQLLLGQLGQQQNPLAATGTPTTPIVPTPSTRYDTRATTYVTTITKHQSTIIPLTFRGKEILTTLVDTSTDVVTATEFITDTVVVTPTVPALPTANLNSLLLLLQKPQVQQVNPLLDPLFAAAPLLTQSNTLPGEVERRNQPVDFDYKPESYEDLSSEEDVEKPSKAKSAASKTNENESLESSVITLYVSGRRPGEFSTVLSTVKVNDESASTKVKRGISEATVISSISPSVHPASEPGLFSLSMLNVFGKSRTCAHALKMAPQKDRIKKCLDELYTTLTRTSELYQDSKFIKGIISSQDFGGKKQVTNISGEYSSTTPRNKIRLRASVAQTRTAGQTSTAVTRRRPFGTTAQSSTSTTETTPTQEKLELTPKTTPKSRRLFAKTRARTGHSLDLETISDSTPSSSAKPTKLFGSTKSARPISSTKPVKSFSATKSAKSLNPTKTTSLTSSTISSKSINPTKSTSIASFAKSAKSISPSKPANFISSSRPAKPLGPLRFPRPAGGLKLGSTSSLPDSTPSSASSGSDSSTDSFEDSATTVSTTDFEESTGFPKINAPGKVNNRKVVIDSRKKLLQPSSVESTTNRERTTRKKFLGIKPVVKPTSTLAIITSGFYSSSSVGDTYDDYDSDLSKVQTPELYSKTTVANNYYLPSSIHDALIGTEKIFSNTEQTKHHSGVLLRETYDDYDIIESKIRTPDLYSRTDIDNYYYSGRPITLEPEKTLLKSEKTRYNNDSSNRETIDDYDSDESNTETPDLRPKTDIDSYYSLIPFLFGAQKIFSNPDRKRYYNSPLLQEKLDDYDNYGYSKVQTPNLRASTVLNNYYSPSPAPPEVEKKFSNPNKTSFSSPIIITDNFFFPLDGGEIANSKNKYYTDNDSDIEDDDSIDVTTSNIYETENIASSPDDEKSLFKNKMTFNFQPIEKVSPMNDYQSVARIKTELRNLSLSLIDRELHKIKVNERLLLDVLLSSSLASRRQRKMKATLQNVENHLKTAPTMTEFNLNTATVAQTREFSGRNKKPSRDQNLPELVSAQTNSPAIEPSRVSKINPISSANVQPITSPLPITPEEIEASLADDLYLSLSHPDFPQIESSKVESNKNELLISTSSQATPVIETSIYFSETVVTSTRLRTYTYVVTKLKGQDTEVSSSTTVRPRITTLTLTIPVTLTVTPTLASSPVALNTLVHSKNDEEAEDSGRRFNLATRVMSNGVEVIVAGTTPAYRWENSNPQPTLTLSEAVLMMLPQDKPNEFVTKTCTTTFTYLNTITRNGTTMVSTDQQVIANTATEERHRKPVTETASVTLEASPTLQTEIFKTTYTYLTFNSDHPDEKNALESSTQVIVNTVTAPQYYLDMILEPSEVARPETNTYYSTRMLEKTYVEEGKTKVETTNDVVTQLIITESAPPSRSGNVASSITSDNVYDKAAVKKTNTKLHSIGATPEPIQIFATKTYLTTYTYFTTLLQAGSKGETSTTVSSRTQIVENVITESIAPSLLDAGYMNALLTTSHNSDSLKNVVTGSTIIFFDDEEQITPTSTFETASTSSNSFENASPAPIEDAEVAESNDVTSRPVEPDSIHNEEEVEEESTSAPPNKKPSQVSNLLSLGSLGINSLSALGPVFSAMAGLLQGKNSATRRNDTEPIATEPPVSTTQRSPIKYIPVGDFADVDIETAESQNIALRVAGNNHLPETRHKVASSLVDGIPISPGEIITANSDVIIGRPGKMGPRPPQTYAGSENIGMKPPPVPVPNIPVHPVLEVLDNDSSKKLITVNNEPLEIYPAHQIYEDHIKDHIKLPPVRSHSSVSQKHTDLQQTFLHAPPPPPPKTISSKQDILENDPLLIPPSAFNSNSNNQQKSERKKHPWSPKDPLTATNILVEDKHQVSYPQKDFIQTENTSGSKSKVKVPEPIIHQVPHVIDRSTGQPLLVNIQPSQVANVIIPQGGTQALIFGDTNEPHISGQYFDDPSPYPEPEVGPGFIGIDKVENLPQYSRKDNPSDYMTPPIQTTNLRPTDNNHNVGQGHVHTEILVHHGVESGFQRQQNKPSRNHQNVHFPPRREHVNVHIPVEQTPPRRTEVPLSTDNLYFESGNSNVNTNKKSHRNPPPRWPRPTARPRPPTRITGRPHGRPPTRIERPVNSNRPQPPLTQGLPNVHYQNEFNKHQYPSTETPVIYVNQKPHHSDQDGSHYEHYDVNSQNNRKNSVQSNQEEHVSNAEFGDKIITVGEGHNETNYVEKVSDSEVDASENVKITSEPHGGDNRGDFIIYDSVEPESTSKYEPNEYFNSNISIHSDDSVNNKKPLYNINNQDKIIDDEIGDIIIGSEKKQDQYIVQPPPAGIITNQHSNGYQIQVSSDFEQKPIRLHDTIDLNPPAIIPKFEPNGHSRPFSNPHVIVASSGNKTKHNVDTAEKNQNVVQGHILQGLGQVIHVQTEKKDSDKQLKTQKYEPNQVRGKPRPDYTTQVHPNHPQIITKLKPQVPGPVTIFSDKVHKQSHNSHRRPTQQFSLPIDSIGEENESKTQTERAPSSDNKVEESLDTAFQTNFASTDSKEQMENKVKNQTTVSFVEHQGTTKLKTIPLSQDMKPPPVSTVNTQKVIVKNPLADAGLKPPPPPRTDVLGLSPPPVDITTTAKPASVENKPKKTSVSGLKPPPLYIPLKESKITPSLPSTSMVPPNIRPSVVRPYLAEILSEDMIPPPPEIKTTQTIELATARPGVEVSGSIQIATAVAASHIPVMQDSESKIPIVHGTVDLPVVIDVPEFLKPIDTKVPNHVSVYTVLPFETKQRNTIKPTISPSRVSSSTQVRQSQIHRKQENSNHHQIYSSSRLPSSQIVKRPHKVSEISIILEPSTDVRLGSTRIEPTRSLSNSDDHGRRTKQKHTQAGGVTKTLDVHYVRDPDDHGKSYPQNVAASRKTDLRIKESASKMMEIIGTVVHEFIQNSTNEKVETKPQEVTRFETLTVTRTETSVLGSPPTTRTLLITHTLTSTSVETVTETLLRPTSVISTITSTVLHPVTRVPTYENEHENESIFVVMSDQKPPVGLEGAEEVEAEYGDEDVSRDEQDTSGNEIHRVLSGGIGGAPSVPIRPPKVHCLPECKAAKSEICAELRGEMHCVCRPGFSRMFPDRPCKPTYTYTVSVGLDRFGRDRFVYNPAMNDSNSVIFRRYAHPIKEALDRTLMQSDLRDVYRDINVVKFLPEPARVLFNVQLSSNTEETRLADVIRKYLMMSNYSLGGTDVYAAKDLGMIEATDFDECTTEENGPHHDCSPHAMCFNLKGTYQCSCKEGWADLSENSAYPGRHCSQAPLGCSACNNKGHCVVNSHGQEMCECFLWHTGKKCQINLKVLLIALVSTGVILLGLLAVCLGMACLRNPNRRGNSADRRAMISGMAGNDSSSETSIAELAIPHHVPHILPPPPQMLAPAPPIGCKPLKKMIPPSHNKRRAPRKAPAPLIVPVPVSNHGNNSDQRDRSLTVMIPRAKYRSMGQTPTQLSCKPMSTFSVEEHKLIDYLEGNSHQVCGNRKASFVSNSDYKDPEPRYKQQQANFTTTASGALVSAGFQVSATVTTRGGMDPAVDSMKADLTEPELETRIQAATVGSSKQQMLRLDFAEAGSTLARSCGETTIQPPTKMAERKGECRGDSASEGHTMAERDCGSTLRLPAQHAPLYVQDRTTSSDRESNFDSL